MPNRAAAPVSHRPPAACALPDDGRGVWSLPAIRVGFRDPEGGSQPSSRKRKSTRAHACADPRCEDRPVSSSDATRIGPAAAEPQSTNSEPACWQRPGAIGMPGSGAGFAAADDTRQVLQGHGCGWSGPREGRPRGGAVVRDTFGSSISVATDLALRQHPSRQLTAVGPRRYL